MPSPTNFDQAGQFARRADYNLSVACVDMDTVVTHQHGVRDQPGAPGKNEIERETRFAGARRAADQDRTISHQHRRGVDAGRPRIPSWRGQPDHAKRAPATVARRRH